MKIDDQKKSKPVGAPLSSFSLGSCVRLVGDDYDGFYIGQVYIVATVGSADHTAINLKEGCHRVEGRFVLEPNARVVIE